jgi:hypothetical protein
MTFLALLQERAHLSIETVQGVGHPRIVKKIRTQANRVKNVCWRVA